MGAHVYQDGACRTPAEQMAMDEAILRTAPSPSLRIYRWSAAAVSFGYGQRVRDVRARFPETSLVRRWTGGGMVEHGEDVTFSIFDPVGGVLCRMRPGESYEQIHRMVLRALTSFAPGAHLVSPEDAKNGEACFQNPSTHDISSGSAKFCGGAQRRTREGLLHQGSIQGLKLPADFGQHLGASLFPDAENRTFSSSLLLIARQIASERYSRDQWLEKR